jgi:hypothetical protein
MLEPVLAVAHLGRDWLERRFSLQRLIRWWPSANLQHREDLG